MNKKELIERVECLKKIFGNEVKYIEIDAIIELVSKLDEPEKVTIPQFVADWIEECKAKEKSLLKSLLYTPSGVNRWVDNSENQETFARAWLDGYEVENEKRYLVKVKGINGFGCYLNKGLLSKEYFFESKAEIGGCRTKHTRKQLEDDDFGWVFDCEGIEIEEVEKELNNDQ